MSLLQFEGGQKASLFKFLPGIIIALLLLIVILVQTTFSNTSNSHAEKIIINAELLSHSVLGFRFLVADNLWIRLLQDIDYRESGVTNKGWVFHMLDAITTLDPRYKLAYEAGAVILSVVVRDKEGSRIIYERAVKNYPYDWSLAYRASYQYLIEIKNCKRAAELFKQAVENGAPAWVAALSGRLFVKSGQFEMARSVLVDTLEKNKGSEFEGELKKRLSQLEEHFQKSNDSDFLGGLNCQ